MNDVKELIRSLKVQEFTEEVEQIKISVLETGSMHFNLDDDGCFSTVASWN